MARAAKPRLRGSRALDFATYALIGIAIYAGIIWIADEGADGGAIAKWYGLGLYTIVAFGEAVARHRQSWKRLSFWVVLLGIVAIHLLLFISVLTRVDEWKAIWWAVLYPIESVTLNWGLSFFGFTESDSEPNQMLR